MILMSKVALVDCFEGLPPDSAESVYPDSIDHWLLPSPAGGNQIALRGADTIDVMLELQGMTFFTPATIRELEKRGRELFRVVPERILL